MTEVLHTPKPQQNPLKLHAVVGQHDTESSKYSSAFFTARGPVLLALPSSRKPTAVSSGEIHTSEQGCTERAEPPCPFPAPRQHWCCTGHLHPKDNLTKPAGALAPATEKCTSRPLLKLH